MSTVLEKTSASVSKTFKQVASHAPNRIIYSSQDGLESLYWVGDHGQEGIHFHEASNVMKHIYVNTSGLVIQEKLDIKFMLNKKELISYIEFN